MSKLYSLNETDDYIRESLSYADGHAIRREDVYIWRYVIVDGVVMLLNVTENSLMIFEPSFVGTQRAIWMKSTRLGRIWGFENETFQGLLDYIQSWISRGLVIPEGSIGCVECDGTGAIERDDDFGGSGRGRCHECDGAGHVEAK